jgi:hypothetical protein
MRQLGFLCLAVAMSSCSLLGQDRASIEGTVFDTSHKAVGDAEVDLISPATALHRHIQSSDVGVYRFQSLLVGKYQITIKKQGFKTFVLDNVDLNYGDAKTLDANLQLGTTTSVVDVTAAAEVLNRSNAEVAGVIESPQIREIPLNGRNWATLMTLAPGAVNTGDGGQRSIRFNGHSLDDSNFTFDGIDTSGVQEQTQKADTRLNISTDAIEEFRVSSAVYTAESGAAGGAQINVVSKAGTNDFHGSLYEFLRNDKLDARSPFDPSQIPPFRLNQFGVALGGPIVKDKAFFFANYEGLRQSLGQTLIGFVPNAAFRDQVLQTSPVLKPLIEAYPQGQIPIDNITDQLSLQGRNTVREDTGLFRVDYRFSDNSTAYVRYNIDNAYIDSPTDALGTHNVIPHTPQNVVLQFQHIFSPTLINESKLGMNRANYRNYSYGTSPISVDTGGIFDTITDNTLDEEVGTTFSYSNTLTKIAGRHNLKFGIDIRRIRLNNSGNAIRDSTIVYASADNFVNNQADEIDALEGEAIRGNRRTFYSGFAQDDLKVSPTLTLNLGLRYEFYSVAHEILDRAAVVDIQGCGGFCPKGTPFYNPNYRDFGPRVGGAWTPAFLGGKTVFRTGFGIYYESSVPRYKITSSDIPSIGYPIAPFIAPEFALFGPKAIDRHRKDLSYQNWDFVVEQQLPSKFLARAGYVGSVGRHLFTRYQVNLIDPVTGERPLPNFSQFGLKANDGNNSFNALQLSLERRFSNGLLWQTEYMWSHAITDASIGAGESVAFQNQSCRACDRSSSPYDVRHTSTTNAIYELPVGPGRTYLNSPGVISAILGGWKISGLATASTGQPVNITINRSSTALPDGNRSAQRPDLVPGVSIYAAHRTIDNWFNPAAFQTPAPGTWGNLGRFAARGPGFYEIDTALEKEFKVTERFALRFRAEAFNLFNHPIYDVPSGNLSSGSFGQITSVLNTGAVGTGTPRRIQFGVRLAF